GSGRSEGAGRPRRRRRERGLRRGGEALPQDERPARRADVRQLRVVGGAAAMDVWLVTGGAGFIGSNFVRLALALTAARVIVLDKLTYAGNLESLGDVASSPRFH